MVLPDEKSFILFIFYSFLGWSWETLQYTIENRHFINRGFLKGSYCPIYGWGALGIVTFLSSIENIAVLFLAGLVLCTALEYVTSYVLEKLFHKRWWDYSSYKYSLHGRICLLCSTAFGVLSVLLVKFVQPFMDKVFLHFPVYLIHFTFIITFIVYLADNLYTFYNMTGSIRESLSVRLKAISTASQFSNKLVLRISEKIFGDDDDK